MKTNIHEIALKAGVSIATVSRALNNKGPVNAETKKKILQLAQEYNYKPSPLARGLSRQQTETIGVILPELVDEFFSEILRGIDEEAYQSNNYVLVSSSHSQRNTMETLLEFMSSGRVDGVILMAPKIQQDMAAVIQKSKRPVVLLNCGKDIENVVSVNINDYRGAVNIVEHLIEHGYQRLAMMKGPKGNFDAGERLRGFKETLAKHSLKIEPDYIVPGDYTVKSGYYGFMRLMSQSPRPEAIFAANDMMALGAYEAARTANIKIPQDVAIVGFDDIFTSQYLRPRLTTVHVPIVELGQKAVQYLLKIISGKMDRDTAHREELTTGIVIGGSCGCKEYVAPVMF